MTNAYLSSTFSDLGKYRDVVCRSLRIMNLNVVAMEDYVARDERPVKKCLADVGNCEIYIGIFAWRYGFIPKNDNPEELSITELEYQHARREGKTCLCFLLDENAPWPPKQMERGNAKARLERLRDELVQNAVVSLFTNEYDLAWKVSLAVYQCMTGVLHRAPVESIRILYVEDAQFYVDIYAPVLERYFGAENVAYAKTAKDALDQLRQDPSPDVLISDLHLVIEGDGYQRPGAVRDVPLLDDPLDNGIAVCAEALWLGIPVVVLSGVPMMHESSRLVETARRIHGGVVFHLQKQQNPAGELLVNAIVQAHAVTEREALAHELGRLRDQWTKEADGNERRAILNGIRRALEGASHPALREIRCGKEGRELRDVLDNHVVGGDEEDEGEEERAIRRHLRRLLSPDGSAPIP